VIIFDIETGPLPDDHLQKMLPDFDPDKAVPDPGKFEAASVKTGNLGAEKAAEKIAKAKDDHAKAVKNRKAKVEKAREEHFAKFKEKAALSPLYGQVLAIGILDDMENRSYITQSALDDEDIVIKTFWSTMTSKNIGHNIHGFDLPFLVRRSWANDIAVPQKTIENYRFWHHGYVDLMQVWQLGNRQEYVSLDTLCKFFGIPGKPDDVGGADFARLFNGTPEERKQALDYLSNDLTMTKGVAQAMGLF